MEGGREKEVWIEGGRGKEEEKVYEIDEEEEAERSFKQEEGDRNKRRKKGEKGGDEG